MEIKNNELIVGYKEDPLLYKKEVELENLHWINEPELPLKCKVRLRHRQALQDCVLDSKIKFDKPQRAVTPGQFAVFYLNKQCLGGGVVK